jgi:hypothetical protein
VVPDKAALKGEAENARKERATFHLPVDLMERVRNCVWWSPGLTMGQVAEAALRKEIDALEKKNGGPYAPRKSNLKGGRPMK